MASLKVYKFGTRWHWRCDRSGQCEGGPKRTQQEAYAAAEGHYVAEHGAADEQVRVEAEAWREQYGEVA